MTFEQAFRSGGRTIACDLDDVLSRTNESVCEMHNEIYGTDMVLDDFQHYLYWQNRGWGDPQETITKIKELYARGLLMRSPPLEGAREGLLQLRAMGYRLVLVTARSETQRAGTEEWISRHYEGIFEEMHFTGAFTHLDKLANESGNPPVAVHSKKRHKSDVAHQIGAILLIDDSIENALDCATAHPAVPTLLFGKWPWNRYVSKQTSPSDMLAHSERVARGIDSEEGEAFAGKLSWSGEDVGQVLPECVKRVDDWDGVVQFVKAMKAEYGGRSAL